MDTLIRTNVGRNVIGWNLLLINSSVSDYTGKVTLLNVRLVIMEQRDNVSWCTFYI